MIQQFIIILAIILLYLFIMYFLSFLFVPNLLFHGKPKDDLPTNVKKDMKKLGNEKISKKELLKKVIYYMNKRFYGGIGKTFFHFNLLFETSISKLWKKGGYIHCNQYNFLLKNLLLETKKFEEKDIKIKLTSVYLEIHQYLSVNIGEKKWITADPFWMSLGFELGKKMPFAAIKALKKKKSENINNH